ncbi:MAG TPA: twin-arginine translocation signal domain-containing protein [Jiangellaceae bacterium]|nr:twin-arginine translocation signal domain-containing protein [Jiangellaceae bacterium]
MNHLSRRTFIGGAAAGVAAATVAAVPGLAAAATHSPDDDGDAPDLAGPVLARLRDVRTGEITLYVGTDEISYTDRTLARRLARAAAR